MNKQSEQIAKANEIRFQEAYSKWESLNKPRPSIHFDIMFNSVHFAVSNIMKKILKNVKTVDFEGKVTDATIDVMNSIVNKNKHPEKLSSYVYWYIIGVLYNKKTRQAESEYSYEELLSPSKSYS